MKGDGILRVTVLIMALTLIFKQMTIYNQGRTIDVQQKIIAQKDRMIELLEQNAVLDKMLHPPVLEIENTP